MKKLLAKVTVSETSFESNTVYLDITLFEIFLDYDLTKQRIPLFGPTTVLVFAKV